MRRIERIAQSLQLAFGLIRHGNGRDLIAIAGNKTWHSFPCFGLRRDLALPFSAPAAAIPITIRPLREDDVPRLLDLDAPGLDRAGRHERFIRLQMARAGFASCYVAVTADDEPCYLQWLITPAENDLVRAHFGGLFPLLQPGEALLEGAFTPERFRGQRIMPAAMARIAERAVDAGARFVVTFVAVDNVASLKGCKRAGFTPYALREERWRLGRRRVSFMPLPVGTPYPFDVSPPVEVRAASA